MLEVGELGFVWWCDFCCCFVVYCRGVFGGMFGCLWLVVYFYCGVGIGVVWNLVYCDCFDGWYVLDFIVFLKMGLVVGDISVFVWVV